jgi:hypothetical protein
MIIRGKGANGLNTFYHELALDLHQSELIGRIVPVFSCIPILAWPSGKRLRLSESGGDYTILYTTVLLYMWKSFFLETGHLTKP